MLAALKDTRSTWTTEHTGSKNKSMKGNYFQHYPKCSFLSFLRLNVSLSGTVFVCVYTLTHGKKKKKNLIKLKIYIYFRVIVKYLSLKSGFKRWP